MSPQDEVKSAAGQDRSPGLPCFHPVAADRRYLNISRVSEDGAAAERAIV